MWRQSAAVHARLHELQLLHDREQRLGDAAVEDPAHTVRSASKLKTFFLSSSSKCSGLTGGSAPAVTDDQRAQRAHLPSCRA